MYITEVKELNSQGAGSHRDPKNRSRPKSGTTEPTPVVMREASFEIKGVWRLTAESHFHDELIGRNRLMAGVARRQRSGSHKLDGEVREVSWIQGHLSASHDLLERIW